MRFSAGIGDTVVISARDKIPFGLGRGIDALAVWRSLSANDDGALPAERAADVGPGAQFAGAGQSIAVRDLQRFL